MAAFDFPASPAIGTSANGYTWDGKAWKISNSLTKTFTAVSPPAGAVDGDLWWEDDTGSLYIYFDDGTSSQWVMIPGGVGGVTTTMIRERLTAARDYYVTSTGNDANSGLTAGTPFLTIQKAIDIVSMLDIGIYSVTIHVADGTYTGANNVNGAWLGTGRVSIVGNVSIPANVLIDPGSGSRCFVAQNGGTVFLSGMELRGYNGVFAAAGGSITLDGPIRFGPVAYSHIYCDYGGRVSIGVAYTVSGGGPAHIFVATGGFCWASGLAVTFVGNPNFSSYLIFAGGAGAQCSYFSNTFSPPTNAFVGQRYAVSNGGFLSVNGAPTTYLPGTIAGTGTTFAAAPWGLYL